MMTTPKLDWWGHGYYFDPSVLEGASAEVRQWWEIFDRCRRGDFSATPRLLDLYQATRSPLLRQACSRLLGDAGSGEAIEAAVEWLARPLTYDAPLDPYVALHLLNAVAWRGHLADVPGMLRIYEWIIEVPDARAAALYFSWMLEPRWGELSDAPRGEEQFEAYCAQVQHVVTARLEAVRSDRVPLFLGKILDVGGLARTWLDNLGDDHNEQAVQPMLRRRFEASTGTDCSTFFEGGAFRALTAASELEGFLAAKHHERYAPGQRYFFGHRIPPVSG